MTAGGDAHALLWRSYLLYFLPEPWFRLTCAIEGFAQTKRESQKDFVHTANLLTAAKVRLSLGANGSCTTRSRHLWTLL